MSGRRKPIRVLLVDDHPVVRMGLHAMLSSDRRIKVVGEAGSGEEAIEKTNRLEPEVVLTDIRMPGMNGIEVTRRIKAQRPSTVVIVLTMYDSDMYIVEAIGAGAAGYLVKDSSQEFIRQAVHAVVGGGTIVEGDLLRRTVQGLSRGHRQPVGAGADPPLMERLTARELEVLHRVVQGRANREIAGEMYLAEATVKKYVRSIIGKLGASDRTHAAILALRMGLVE